MADTDWDEVAQALGVERLPNARGASAKEAFAMRQASLAFPDSEDSDSDSDDQDD